MSGTHKKMIKKGTKLSLTKKATKTEVSSTCMKNGIRNILDGNIDLNETCEFRDPRQFSGCGDRNARHDTGSRGKTVEKAYKSGEKISTESKEVVRCQVCNKNISHMTVQRREQHVNKCIDNIEDIEKQQKEEQQVLEAARTAVLDCPMCGKHFKAENARISHLKRCCQELGVSTEKMIQLVKEQEQERQKQLDTGIIPQQLRSKVTKSVAPKKRKLKEPKSQFEEDVQVAMAMSSSLSSTSDNSNAGKKKKNKKAVLEDVCLLTTLTDEIRQKRIEEKVSNVLYMANFTCESVNVVLQESSLSTGSRNDNSTLWGKCSQDPVTCDIEHFYVGALVPPLSISKSVPGKNIQRLSSIPGRDNSLINKEATPVKSKMSDEGIGDIITASTQTAVVLAELAVDDTNILDVTDLQNTDNVVDLQASGFCLEEMVLNKCDSDDQVAQTLLDYKSMVNNKEYSDVTVTSSCGQTFYTHKVILAARCPRLLQMMKDSVIKLDINPDSLLIFLNFIYTGNITLTPSSQSELLFLSNQLEFTPLIDVCNKVVLQEERSDSVNLTDDQESPDNNFIESKLDMKEIWGESDSDLDLNEGEESADKERSSDHGINENDFTQHRKLRNRLSQSFTDTMKSEDIPNMKENSLVDDFPTNNQNELTNNCKDLEPGDECVSVNSESIDENNDNEVMDIDLDYENDRNEKDTDSDISPSSKKIRLCSETEPVNDKEVAETSASSEITEENVEAVHGRNIDYKGCNKSWKQVKEVVEIVEDIVNDSTTRMDSDIVNDSTAGMNSDIVNDSATGMDSSTADLFDSPSPKRDNVTSETIVRDKNEPLFAERDIENKSKVSTHLGKKYTFRTSRKNLDKKELPVAGVIEIDSDSTQDDMDNVRDVGSVSDVDHASDVGQVESTPECDKYADNLDENCGLNASDLENEEIDKDSNAGQLYKVDKYVSDGDGCESESNVTGSDDDLQITGDNLDDFIQNSPTFHPKTISAVRKGNNTEKIELETKYLGLKSFTEGQSGSMRNLDSEREEMIEIQTEDNNVSGEFPGNTDNISVPSVEQVNNEADGESCVEEYAIKSPEKDYGRGSSKSKAYGTHEMSVYTDDAEDAATPNTSFKAGSADVWEDFDDCGMGYEPPEYDDGSMCDYQLQDRSPGNMSDPVQCRSAEGPGELSPVIPIQEDVIDLSRNEDDNDIYEKQPANDIDSALLDDGEDSFVFKVTDQQETKETPATKIHNVKKGNFKTPTVVENRGKKHQWEPPSPFTPMPEYGSMATPALKKAVQKYGMKPVGKKRMVKVLEDIYHQTHQYETDSDCEEEEHTDMPLYNGGGGGGDDGGSLPCSQGDVSSQDSDISDVLEESCLHMSSDSDTASSPQKNVDVAKKLFQFIKTRPEIHARILMYEPLELDVLKKDVKESGIKCSMDKLMDFLDERCIAFTSKNSRNRQSSRRGKQKTTKSKKKDIQPAK